MSAAVRSHQISFSFVVSDQHGFTDFALYLPADLLADIGVCLKEMARCERLRARKKLQPIKAVLPFSKRKRPA